VHKKYIGSIFQLSVSTSTVTLTSQIGCMPCKSPEYFIFCYQPRLKTISFDTVFCARFIDVLINQYNVNL